MRRSLPSVALFGCTFSIGKFFGIIRVYTVYFSDPFFPKGTSFAGISDDDLQLIVDLINNRPRKRLNYLTPFEVINKFFS